ncbi:MAG: hypothetical protein ACLU9S_03745 [Oscillospiraceae bacterium]
MLIYIAMCIVAAVLMAKWQMKKGAGVVDGESTSEVHMEYSELACPRLFWFNLLLTVALIVGLTVVPCPDYFIFAVGLVIAMAVNYPDQKLQGELMKSYGKQMYSTACAIFLSGVVVGVLSESPMMDAMVDFLIGLIPTAMGPWMYLDHCGVQLPADAHLYQRYLAVLHRAHRGCSEHPVRCGQRGGCDGSADEHGRHDLACGAASAVSRPATWATRPNLRIM